MKRQNLNHDSANERQQSGVDNDMNEDMNTETKEENHVEGIEANKNEAMLKVETSHTFTEHDVESDGVAEIYCDTAIGSRTLTNTTPNKLPDGFGFTTETRQYRHATRCSHNASLHAPIPVVGELVDSIGEVPDNVYESTSVTNNQIANEAECNTAKIQQFVEVECGVSNQQSINNDNGIGLVPANQACIGKHITTEQVSKSDIEMDVIYTRQLREKKLEDAPESVPSDYVDMNPKNQPTEHKLTFICMIPIGRKNPDQTSSILIPHRNADKPEGDEFGTRLCTFKEKQRNEHIYYRHFFVGVEPGGPADCMGIEDNDELVLLNDVFVAAKTHTETLNLFHNAKVDGHTRFTLVIRRVEEVQNEKKWQWIETSAILAPNKERDDRPIVEDVEYKQLIRNRKEIPKSSHLYKVPGTNQRYLDIRTSSASIDVLTGNDSDNTKIIWKRIVYSQNDSGYIVDMTAALCDHTMTSYIASDQRDNILVQPEPQWFGIITIGDKVRFKLANKDLYLGYNLDTGQMKAQISHCVFHEYPASMYGDIRHPSTSQLCESAGQSCSGSSPRSSISSQISIDSGSYNVSFHHSSSSDSTESSSFSLSQSSSRGGITSGYNSSATPPNSLPDDMDMSELHGTSTDVSEKRYESKNGSLTTPKTPTTPMSSLAMHDKNIVQYSESY